MLETTAGAAGIFGNNRNYQNRSVVDRVRGVLTNEGYEAGEVEEVIAGIEKADGDSWENSGDHEYDPDDIGAVGQYRGRKGGKGKNAKKTDRSQSTTFRPKGIMRRRAGGLTLNSGKG